MDEIEDAMTAWPHAGHEVGPGHRTLWRIGGAERLIASLLRKLLEVRPIEEVRIWSRNLTKAETFVAEHSDHARINLCASPTVKEAVADADIVCTVTGAHQPILEGVWLKPGVHLNLVGAHTPDTREADSDLMANGSVFVDLMESAMNESGDILIPISEGRFESSHVRGEIGHVVAEELDGRRSSDDVTVYVSLGITAQDLYAAHAIFRAAQEAGLGTEVSL